MKKFKRVEKLDFGTAIREFRLAAGLSQDDLVDRADMHKSYLSMLENRKRQPSPEMLVRIARALNIPPGDLLNRAAESYPDPDPE